MRRVSLFRRLTDRRHGYKLMHPSIGRWRDVAEVGQLQPFMCAGEVGPGALPAAK